MCMSSMLYIIFQGHAQTLVIRCIGCWICVPHLVERTKVNGWMELKFSPILEKE